MFVGYSKPSSYDGCRWSYCTSTFKNNKFFWKGKINSSCSDMLITCCIVDVTLAKRWVHNFPSLPVLVVNNYCPVHGWSECQISHCFFCSEWRWYCNVRYWSRLERDTIDFLKLQKRYNYQSLSFRFASPRGLCSSNTRRRRNHSQVRGGGREGWESTGNGES